MKHLFNICMILCSLIATTSCNNDIKESRLRQIDSLGTHLNHVREVVGAVDSQMIVNRIQQMEETGSWVLDNLTDTLDPESGIILGDHLRCQKFYKKAILRYGQVKSELEFSEKQLATLRTDVKNSFYSEEEFTGYFKAEAESLDRLVKATDELEGTYESVNVSFERTKPGVTSLLDSIKSVIYSSEPI